MRPALNLSPSFHFIWEEYPVKNMFLLINIFCIFVLIVGCEESTSPQNNVVVVYTSEDQVFSEPILRDFEKETGIKVKAVFDTEESKSTGVMNRLIAEKNNPQADVFWANEPRENPRNG